MWRSVSKTPFGQSAVRAKTVCHLPLICPPPCGGTLGRHSPTNLMCGEPQACWTVCCCVVQTGSRLLLPSAQLKRQHPHPLPKLVGNECLQQV